MPDDDLKNIDPVLEAKFYQESLDFEDREQDRLDNELCPEEIMIILVALLIVGVSAYFLLS
jgi:hypothetical protein